MNTADALLPTASVTVIGQASSAVAEHVSLGTVMTTLTVPVLLEVPVVSFTLSKLIVSDELFAKSLPVIVTEVPAAPVFGLILIFALSITVNFACAE